MPEAVIVDAARSPIGRAFKGSLAQLRPEETAAFIVDQLLERNPDVAPEIDRGRLSAAAACPRACRRSTSPGSSSLLSEQLPQTSPARRSRATAPRPRRDPPRRQRDQGRRGRRLRRRRGRVRQPLQRAHRARRRRRPERRTCRARTASPNAYIDMGLTAVNVAKKYEVSRADMDKYAQRSQELAVASQEDGFFDREIVPVTDQDGNEVAKDDGPRAVVDAREARHSSTRGVRRRRRHRRQLVPAQRRRRRGAGDVATRRPKELGLTPQGAARHRGDLGQRARVHGRRPDRRDQEGARARPG